MSDLAAQTSLTPSGLTRAIDRLEAAGLVERKGRCFGDAQYAAVQERWESTADIMEAVADLEEALIHALAPTEAGR